jgi:heme-degrading monooxygenase HmoA
MGAGVSWHIAQINIARFRLDRGDPVNADFETALGEVNALAEAAPGFVWRMTGEGESDDPTLTINLTVWETVDHLAAFAYRNVTHRAVMRRKREWFVELPAYLALWWVKAGSVPTLAEGMARLETIGRLGPTADAFDFRTVFVAPD